MSEGLTNVNRQVLYLLPSFPGHLDADVRTRSDVSTKTPGRQDSCVKMSDSVMRRLKVAYGAGVESPGCIRYANSKTLLRTCCKTTNRIGSERLAWKQVCQIIGNYGNMVTALETTSCESCLCRSTGWCERGSMETREKIKLFLIGPATLQIPGV